MTLGRLIASGFGSGFAPLAAGTVASALATLAGAGLMLGPGWVLPVAVTLSALAGLWAISAAQVEGDPGWVVIDEVAGQWIGIAGAGTGDTGGVAGRFRGIPGA